MDIVRQELRKISSLLQQKEIPHAIVGQCAVVAWMELIDPDAEELMTCPIVLVSEEYLETTRTLLESDSYRFRITDKGIRSEPTDLQPDLRPIEFHSVASKINRDPSSVDQFDAVDLSSNYLLDEMKILSLDGLLLYHLNELEPENRQYICELIKYGLIDSTWLDRLPPATACKLTDLFSETSEF